MPLAGVRKLEAVSIHADEASRFLHAELQQHPTLAQITANMQVLSQTLLCMIRRHLGEDVTPVLVMRGGILMWNAMSVCFPASPAGVIVPARVGHIRSAPRIVYGNVPGVRTGTTYLLLDPIINSGSTIVSTLQAIRRHVGITDHIAVAAIYSTSLGSAAIHAEDPDVHIYTMWADMKCGPDLRLTGVDFDGGDAAFGGGTRRHQWARGVDDNDVVREN
ncbi:MAG TPA: hypothetical protein DGG94_12680 [Micromonosporaceae bacterium]|nr:hypothetical protein [Micromonosporaceae bacterium]HCU50634.1 hypothetical protein [Micromonosporaceae bacterium]